MIKNNITINMIETKVILIVIRINYNIKHKNRYNN